MRIKPVRSEFLLEKVNLLKFGNFWWHSCYKLSCSAQPQSNYISWFMFLRWNSLKTLVTKINLMTKRQWTWNILLSESCFSYETQKVIIKCWIWVIWMEYKGIKSCFVCEKNYFCFTFLSIAFLFVVVKRQQKNCLKLWAIKSRKVFFPDYNLKLNFESHKKFYFHSKMDLKRK